MPYRVIQWATGAAGRFCLQQIIDDPELELVGVWVSGPDDDGLNEGELCGGRPNGVKAATSDEAIIALNADVLIHSAARFRSFDEAQRLLTSGENVVSAMAYFSPAIDGGTIEPTESACSAVKSTLYGAGWSSGFLCDRVPALMTGSTTNINQIRVVETHDVSTYAAPQLLADIGFGKAPSELSFDSADIQRFATRMFPAAIGKLADRLGIRLDEVRLLGVPELAVAPRDLNLAIGHFEQGTITGVFHEFGGYRDGKLVISHKWVHFADRNGIPEYWPMPPEPRSGEVMPYHALVEIDGRPSLRVDMVYPDSDDAGRAVPELNVERPGILSEPLFGIWTAAS